MSLSRLALRILTVRALRGQTSAADFVRDSEIGVLDVKMKEERSPFIAVYIDEARAAGAKLDLLSHTISADLVLELGVSTQMQADPDGEPQFGVPLTDPGLELLLDLIERQAKVALATPTGAWAALWQRLVANITAIKIIRGAADDKGVRFAGRQITVTCDLIAEPPIGRPATGLWADIIAALSADEELSPVGELMATAIDATTLADYLQAAAQLGVGVGIVDGLGITPPYEADGEAAPLAVELTLDADGAELVVEAPDA